ncbi:MAG: SRPBCC family protein, partial [Candidatus Neomarinimicrobiota bacterium]|nr:SRPBCC family protein [Candidatus Neomarinimicrobiota bacterium]
MKTFELTKTQVINSSMDNVFDFFSKPENLKAITPEKLSFKILTPTPITMGKGTVIDYTIRLFKIPVHWRTLITKYDPPHEFIDEQMKGPYNFWHHTHKFKKVDGGVEISDKVIYSIPMGIIGRFLHFLWIKRDLEKIFS